MVGIYKIVNPKGSVYIGQSWNIEKRHRAYERAFCRSQRKPYHSIKYYGWEAHTFSVVHSLPIDVSQEVLNRYEEVYYDQYTTCSTSTLNIRKPGSNGKLSAETKKKLSLAHKGKIVSEATRLKMSTARKNLSQRARQAVSDFMTGRPSAKRKAVEQYNKNGDLINTYLSATEVAKMLGVKSTSPICECCQGKGKTYKGYIWKYKVK